MVTKPSSSSLADRQLTFQNATIEDIPTIKAMVDAAYSKYIERIGKRPAPMTADWAEMMKHYTILVLRDSERAVGSIAYHREDRTNSLKIENAVVDPTIQGRGYGSYMISYVEKEALKQDLHSVTLYTNVKMVENIGYYGRLGFENEGTLIEEGFERVYFRKRLE
ncbi:Acyl-CoA N-acyltransferase [Penicillium paradoxum]|uniref:Acyl-CoA N-acyltransferase n=1 Tax=Penicillium paradoxum TaxID=176176 RepID=UPI00254780C9|nr:Acyl-CoA N-acyltransferase [Penicillium paradoxum]KAJ5782339.1 Acyl-CoA N-acyltransferase [Penicillium paradoxum]